MSSASIIIGLSAVIVSVSDDTPQVFIIREAEGGDALPFGPFDPEAHPTLELGLRAWVKDQTPVTPGYVEQLYTFGSKGRYAEQQDDGARVISIGYLALTHQEKRVHWGHWYDYFPWEDWREGKPAILTKEIEPRLKAWAKEKAGRSERVDLCFGNKELEWNDEKVLERYELLYEARLVEEARRDKALPESDVITSKSMRYDHRRILATAMGRLRGKLKYRPVVFELMPKEFTLFELQRTVEAISGHALHKQNFRRLVETTGMVEEVSGKKTATTGGRPAALFRFRPEVILERPAPGIKK